LIGIDARKEWNKAGSSMSYACVSGGCLKVIQYAWLVADAWTPACRLQAVFGVTVGRSFSMTSLHALYHHFLHQAHV